MLFATTACGLPAFDREDDSDHDGVIKLIDCDDNDPTVGRCIVCIDGVCSASTCSDGVRGGTESDTDCGGSCSTRCADGYRCIADADCASSLCVDGACKEPPWPLDVTDAAEDPHDASDETPNTLEIAETVSEISTTDVPEAGDSFGPAPGPDCAALQRGGGWSMPAEARYCDLSYAELTNVNLGGVDLRDANLSYAQLNGSLMTNANMTNAILLSANLSRTGLTGANLTNANMSNANMTSIKLTDANLTDANLTDVDLTEAAMLRADLTGANLTGADLTSADLYLADLKGANLTGVIWTDAICPDGCDLAVIDNGCEVGTGRTRTCEGHLTL